MIKLAACPSIAVAASLACGGGVSPSCARAALAGTGHVNWQGIVQEQVTRGDGLHQFCEAALGNATVFGSIMPGENGEK